MLPKIGLGTWQTFDVDDVDRAPLRDVLRAFVDAGGGMIDTSPMYGRAEGVLGDLIAELGVRDRVFLATKIWISGKVRGADQLRRSLQLLRTDRLDLVQVHNLLDVDAHLDTLVGMKRDGIVGAVGITHYHAGAHDDVARVMERRPIDWVQINYSVVEREAERRVLPTARDRGVAVIANRPFAEGAVFARLRNKPLPSWARELDCGSWPQLLLKFVVSHPAVTVAIPATSKPAHLVDDLGAAKGRMPDEVMRARIAEAIRPTF